MQFRFYLFDPDGSICAAEDFSAQDDRDALTVAASLWEACSDICSGYDLWQGTRRVRGGRLGHVRTGIAQMPLRRQQDILDLEERLWEEFAALRRSATLIGQLTELRVRFPQPPTVHEAPHDAAL